MTLDEILSYTNLALLCLGITVVGLYAGCWGIMRRVEKLEALERARQGDAAKWKEVCGDEEQMRLKFYGREP